MTQTPSGAVSRMPTKKAKIPDSDTIVTRKTKSVVGTGLANQSLRDFSMAGQKSSSASMMKK
ncbi:MAG: hypothetical protein HQK87_03815 [Nitrospinae bacterium]|nr:hypothetical protein [Nitrospinota bacterium]